MYGVVLNQRRQSRCGATSEVRHFLAEILKTFKLDKAKTSEHGILSIYLMVTIDRNNTYLAS